MEEEELLRILIIIIVSFAHIHCFASGESRQEKDPLENMNVKDQSIVLKHMQDIVNEPGFDLKMRSQILNPRPALRIFVSSSMSKQLLKSYAREAKHYGGVLVFRGLPGGSVHKLADLVMKIADEDSAPMQIDDEAFGVFAVSSVPTIILSKPESILPEQEPARKFDKIAGTIKVKAALEIFAGNGLMAKEAKELLR